MNNMVNYLQEAINDKTSVNDIVNVFEQASLPMNEEDMVLFETGTYAFTGDELFYFSLVKQVPNNDDEYYQIHVDILYKPNRKNRRFKKSVWDDELDESIFDYIRKSKAYKYAQNDDYIKVEIYMDET